MSFRARSSSSLRALPFSFWAYTSSVHHPRGEHTHTRRTERNKQQKEKIIPWDGGQITVASLQCLNNKQSWLENRASSIIFRLDQWLWNETHDACSHVSSIIPSTSKVSESPRQKQMTCSFSPSKDTKSIYRKRTQRLRQATLVYDTRLYLVMPNFFLESFWLQNMGERL